MGLLECMPGRRVSARAAIEDRFFREAPRAQAPDLMPTMAESNSKPRAQGRKRMRSLDEAQLKQRNLFHASNTRFDNVAKIG